MIDNVSHVYYLKIFPVECDCTFGFDPFSPFSLIRLHWSFCFLLSLLKTEADIDIVAFLISVRALVNVHILKNKDHFHGAGFLTLSIYIDFKWSAWNTPSLRIPCRNVVSMEFHAEWYGNTWIYEYISFCPCRSMIVRGKAKHFQITWKLWTRTKMKRKWEESVNLVKQRTGKHTLSELRLYSGWKIVHGNFITLLFASFDWLIQSDDHNYTF